MLILLLVGVYAWTHSDKTEEYHFHNDGVLNVQDAEGAKPYIPTRLEWLVVKFSSLNSSKTISFKGIYKTNTIVITVHRDAFAKDFPEDFMLSLGNLTKLEIKQYAKNRNWDSWLNIEVQLSPKKGD